MDLDEMPCGITRVGAYAVCQRAHRLLLVHQSAPGPAAGKWTLPGGGVDFGESPAAAVIREVREETGGVADVTELLDVHDSVYDLGDGIQRHGIRLLFTATVSGELAPAGNGEIDAMSWFPVDELPTPVTAWADLAAAIVYGRPQ